MTNFDIIIVGQGLAGSILALHVLEAKLNVLVIDSNKPNSSSKVAAGIINPIVFKRFTKAFMADDTYPYLKLFYKNQQEILNEEFYSEIPIYKNISNENEKRLWEMKFLENGLNKYAKYDTIHLDIVGVQSNEFIHILGAKIKTELFLTATKKYLESNESIIEDNFTFDDLKILDNSVIYKEYKANKIIFCEGWKVIDNPYFKFIDLLPSKGQLLEIEIPELKLNGVFNNNFFVMPDDKNYILGSTYEWDCFDEIPTEEAQNELTTKLENSISLNYKILNHRAGIRPSMQDRHPVVGFLEMQPNLGIFNGLGTKGAMLAPYFAKQLTDNLINNSPIDSTVNVNRFIK